MRFLLSLILMAAAAYFLGLVLDWWAIAIATFAVSLLLPLKPGKAFFAGFLSIALLWFTLAFIADLYNDHILAARISMLFLQHYSPKGIVTITAIIGGLVGGMAAMTGAFIRSKSIKTVSATR
ncbi:hypothetical protein LX64_02094 [Chitinophaga skermanii]|uniref:Uncharacterized protein n=1 Tax=Chitinophaga skermanii TaxID=331697 RepID=A0A327QQT9_9BACT|nr:hypothetical protein [Chitinophaga skermanii]RAJ06966.1 hypothetical protein LX64_02094 [Chitinophaga skermanii]